MDYAGKQGTITPVRGRSCRRRAVVGGWRAGPALSRKKPEAPGRRPPRPDVEAGLKATLERDDPRQLVERTKNGQAR